MDLDPLQRALNGGGFEETAFPTANTNTSSAEGDG